MYQGDVNALIIFGLGVLCALAAWQYARLERAWDWLMTPLVLLVGWLEQLLENRRRRLADRARGLDVPLGGGQVLMPESGLEREHAGPGVEGQARRRVAQSVRVQVRDANEGTEAVHGAPSVGLVPLPAAAAEEQPVTGFAPRRED